MRKAITLMTIVGFLVSCYPEQQERVTAPIVEVEQKPAKVEPQPEPENTYQEGIDYSNEFFVERFIPIEETFIKYVGISGDYLARTLRDADTDASDLADYLETYLEDHTEVLQTFKESRVYGAEADLDKAAHRYSLALDALEGQIKKDIAYLKAFDSYVRKQPLDERASNLREGNIKYMAAKEKDLKNIELLKERFEENN